ncbi:MAG: DUF1461 domain-containing protein, partial [Armatimonadetes bacterium]|nr:DUF1461 domain-containing protein [Anaerolineae bacterium]
AVLLWGSLGALLVIALLWTRDRSALATALLRGGLLTVGGVVVIVLGVIIAWDSFFTTFHQLFFQDGTWIFYYSDTLIRLFPEQFWFDAALLIGGLTVGGALLLIVIARRMMQNTANFGASA